MLDPNSIREKTIEFSCKSKAGHLAPSLSTVELITVLFNDFLNYNPNNPLDSERDRFVLSKGHGAYAYYVILNQLGFLPDWELENFNTPHSTIKGCLTENASYMIEASTGSLGHGLPISVGMALSFKMRGLSNKVICMVGDGEMQEGSNFEALMIAHRFKLDNLLIIIDANELQAMSKVADIGFDNFKLAKVLEAVVETPELCSTIDGHNIEDIKSIYNRFYSNTNCNFQVVVARTIKGKGLPEIENSIKHHYRCPAEDGYNYLEKKYE
ncbi:Transketolase [Pseudoalteromonas luteoviolacea B = ATCC 29581]|nr:Transketolase [Pseudoalteromonas luteoviolacea B = ATCC 29581]